MATVGTSGEEVLVGRVGEALRHNIVYPSNIEVAMVVTVVRLGLLALPIYPDGIMPQKWLLDAFINELRITGERMSYLMRVMTSWEYLVPLDDGRVQLAVSGVAAKILKKEEAKARKGAAEEIVLQPPAALAPPVGRPAIPQAIFRAASDQPADLSDEITVAFEAWRTSALNRTGKADSLEDLAVVEAELEVLKNQLAELRGVSEREVVDRFMTTLLQGGNLVVLRQLRDKLTAVIGD